MACKQLGGVYKEAFKAENFEEIDNLSKQHGTKMFQSGDPDHLKAMGEMQSLVKSPEVKKA